MACNCIFRVTSKGWIFIEFIFHTSPSIFQSRTLLRWHIDTLPAGPSRRIRTRFLVGAGMVTQHLKPLLLLLASHIVVLVKVLGTLLLIQFAADVLEGQWKTESYHSCGKA